MSTAIDLPKKFYTLYMSSGIKTTIAVSENIDWLSEKKKKTIIEKDGKIIDLAFVMLIEEENPNNESMNANTALAYAYTLTGRLKDVAIQRVISYEAQGNGKMPLKKLKDWLNSFIKDTTKYPSYHKIFTHEE